jgi:hypothetical protein
MSATITTIDKYPAAKTAGVLNHQVNGFLGYGNIIKTQLDQFKNEVSSLTAFTDDFVDGGSDSLSDKATTAISSAATLISACTTFLTTEYTTTSDIETNFTAVTTAFASFNTDLLAVLTQMNQATAEETSNLNVYRINMSASEQLILDTNFAQILKNVEDACTFYILNDGRIGPLSSGRLSTLKSTNLANVSAAFTALSRACANYEGLRARTIELLLITSDNISTTQVSALDTSMGVVSTEVGDLATALTAENTELNDASA